MKTKVEDREKAINLLLEKRALPKEEMIIDEATKRLEEKGWESADVKDVIGYCSAYISDQIGNINTEITTLRENVKYVWLSIILGIVVYIIINVFKI
ncbi:MAG TPA: hypothetical protein C5S37_10845 [Methanophagales archaeon]|nr:hypothetical protein [Methanophagales archaeon]